MASTTLTATNLTMLDLVRRTAPDGSVERRIVEIMNSQNEVLEDWTFVTGNMTTGNKTTIRSGIPEPTWRKLYGFVQPTKSATLQVTDNCGMLEAYTQVDKALVDMYDDQASFRLSEDAPHIEGINKELVSTLFYGNEGTEPEAFTGLSPRYNSLSAENASNIIVGGSTTDNVNSSIWLVGWGDNTIHGIVPKGSKAGIQYEDLGVETVTDGNGGMMRAYRTHYRIDAGLTLKDWRFAVRIPNIQSSALTANAATGADLIDLMSQAIDLIPNFGSCRPVFYMNRKIRSFWRRQMRAKALYTTTVKEAGATRSIAMFDEIPVKRCDALLNTEALVS